MASIDVKIVDLKKQRFQLSNTYKSVQKIEKELYDIEKVLGDITGADVYHAIQHRIGKTAEAIEKNEETLIMMREVLDEVITIYTNQEKKIGKLFKSRLKVDWGQGKNKIFTIDSAEFSYKGGKSLQQLWDDFFQKGEMALYEMAMGVKGRFLGQEYKGTVEAKCLNRDIDYYGDMGKLGEDGKKIGLAGYLSSSTAVMLIKSKFEYGFLSMGSEITVGESTKHIDGTLGNMNEKDIRIGAGAGAEASKTAIKKKRYYTLGSKYLNIHGSKTTSGGGVYAGVGCYSGYVLEKGEDGNFDYRATSYLKGKAGGYLLKGERMEGIEILGVKIDVETGAKVGAVSTGYEIGVKDNKFTISLDEAVGVGVDFNLTVDWTDFYEIKDDVKNWFVDKFRQRKLAV